MFRKLKASLERHWFDRATRPRYRGHFDAAWYLATNRDVAEALVDPLEHYCTHGWREGRKPNSHFDPVAYLTLHPGVASSGVEPLLHSLGTIGPTAYHGTTDTVVASLPPPANDIRPPQLASAGLTEDLVHPKEYLRANPDLAHRGTDPTAHWLTTGYRENRSPSPGIAVRLGARAEKASLSAGWKKLTWRGENIALRQRPLSASVQSQILAQTRHDPATAAVGTRSIAGLRQFDAHDLFDRDSTDVDRLFSTISGTPDVVIVMPFLLAGGAEKYAADVVAALTADGKRVLVLVTDHSPDQDAGWESLKILEPMLSVDVLYWKTACNIHDEQGTRLARMINALRPSAVVVVNSRIGYEAVARFGRGLSHFASLHCAYFSLGTPGMSGVPYGHIFPRRTLPFATALTDNKPMQLALNALYGTMPGPGTAILPPCARQISDEEFQGRLARYRKPSACGRRWAWVSRVEPFKGTAILAEIAARRPDDQFDVFGPLAAGPATLGLDQQNICCKGPLADVLSANFSGYEGFLFTSLFEGMPNVVLEMAQHGLPLILADVGGLRDTFDDHSAIFVPTPSDIPQSARDFDAALTAVGRLSETVRLTMAHRARECVARKHAPSVFASALREILS